MPGRFWVTFGYGQVRVQNWVGIGLKIIKNAEIRVGQ